MFDDLETAESKIEGLPAPGDDASESSPQLYRWAHFPAMLAFVVLILPFHGHRWGWQIAIAGAYTVYVFFFAFGSVFQSVGDFFGDPRVSRYAARLLMPHVLVLALIVSGVTWWFHLKPLLPAWATHEGRRPSLWFYCGALLLALAGIAQGAWMAGRMKRRFGPTKEQP
jgi:hypothetical protein